MKKYKNILYSLKRYDYLEDNFTQISNDVFKLTTGNEFKIYCYLCKNYNKNYGYSYPSLSTIAFDTNMSVPTVQKCIKKLEELKLIQVFKFEDKNSKYVNNIYKVYYPIIVKNEIEDERKKKQQEEIEKAFKTMDENVEGKVHVYQAELEEDD